MEVVELMFQDLQVQLEVEVQEVLENLKLLVHLGQLLQLFHQHLYQLQQLLMQSLLEGVLQQLDQELLPKEVKVMIQVFQQ